MGYFNQALDIFAMCAQYRLIPYIRYDVVFRYMMVIGGNFIDNKDFRSIIEGMIFGHFFYYYFDIQAVAGHNIEMYRQKVNEIVRTDLYWKPAIADCPFQMEIGDAIKKAAQSLASKICTAFVDREE